MGAWYFTGGNVCYVGQGSLWYEGCYVGQGPFGCERWNVGQSPLFYEKFEDSGDVLQDVERWTLAVLPFLIAANRNCMPPVRYALLFCGRGFVSFCFYRE